MAVKFKDFLQIWMPANDNVDTLEVYVSDPSNDEEVYRLKKSFRNYILFGDYYVTVMEIDYWEQKVKPPYLSIILNKELKDPLDECPFAYA